MQFNLLPDVKLEYVKAQRLKHLLTTVSILASAAALGLLLFSLFVVKVVQAKSLRDLNKDIKKYSNEIKSTKDLNRMLTVQNQLNTLATLHEANPVSSRVFGYIAQLTPEKTSLDRLSVDYATNSIIVSGSSPSLDEVRVYVDTYKNTKYSLKDSPTETPPKAFKNVVLSSFSKGEGVVPFEIKLEFDPI